MKKVLFSIICCCFISLLAPAQGVVFTPSQPVQQQKVDPNLPDLICSLATKAICTDENYKFAGVDYLQGEKLFVIDKTEPAYKTIDWFLVDFTLANVDGVYPKLIKKETQQGITKIIYKFPFTPKGLYLVALISEERLYLMSTYE